MLRNDSTMLHIGRNRQLFFDNQIIERAQDITRVVHAPKAEPEPLIQADRPWEKITYFAVSTYQVLRDRDGLWRCWYGTWHYDPQVFARSRDWYDFDASFMQVCYASSRDGVHWEKPALGLQQFNGEETNILLGDRDAGGFYQATPIEDPFETDPAKRFKTLGVRFGPKVYRIEAAYSADGVHWTFYDRPPSFGHWGPYLNDMIVLNYDHYGRVFTADVRSPYMGHVALRAESPVAANNFVGPSEPGAWYKSNKRRVWQTESSDLLNWSQPYLIFEPDELDNLDESYYGMCRTQIGDTHIGFVNLFRECENAISVRLAFSRDGKQWEWANQRQPWLEGGKLSGREWDSVMVYLGVPPIQVGDEHWLFYGGAKNHHDWYMTGVLEGIDHPEARDMSRVGYHLGLAKMRLDGFVSLDTSPHREGILVTRPFFPEGNRLVINAQVAAGGYIDVEVTDPGGKVLPGYARADCDRFTGDSVRHVVTWKGNAEAEWVQHTPPGYCETLPGNYKLNFYLRKASLYSFQSTDDPLAQSSVDPDLGRKLRVRKWE